MGHNVNFSEIDEYINNRVAVLRLDTDSEAESEAETTTAFTVRMLQRRYNNRVGPIAIPSPTESERYHMDMYEATAEDHYEDDDSNWDAVLPPLYTLTNTQLSESYFNIAYHSNHWYQSSEDDVNSIYSISDYDTDSDATCVTEAVDSDSDDDFYVPTGVQIVGRPWEDLRPQSGTFSDVDISQSTLFDEEHEVEMRRETADECKQRLEREKILRDGTGKLLDSRNFLDKMMHNTHEPLNDRLGEVLQDIQKQSNLEFLVDLLAASVSLSYKLPHLTSPVRIGFAIQEFYTSVTGTTLSQALNLPEFMQAIFKFTDADAQELTQQAGTFGVTMGSMISGWNLLKTSHLVNKIKKICTLMSVIGIGKALGNGVTAELFNSIWETIGTSLKQVDMVSQVCEVIHLIYEKCIGFWTTGDWGALANVSEMHKLDMDIADALIMCDRVTHGNAIEGDKTLSQLLAETVRLMGSCDNFARMAESKQHRERFAAQKLKMGVLYNLVNQQLRSSPMRPCAGTFLLHGKAGTGKSVLMPFLTNLCLHAMDLPTGAEHVYTFQPGDNYFTGFKSTHVGMMIDDIGNAAPGYTTINPSDLLISMVNNNKVTAVQASLDDKGKCDIVCGVIALSANDRQLKASVYSTHPAAALRRTGWNIEIKVKPEYCIPGTLFINPKIDIDKEKYDVWYVTVDVYNSNTNAYDIISDDDGPLENVSMRRVMVALSKHMTEHRNQQNNLVALALETEKRPYCVHKMPGFMCPKCEVIVDTIFKDDVPALLEEQGGKIRDPWQLYRDHFKWKVAADELYYGGVKAITIARLALAISTTTVLVDVYVHGGINLLSSIALCVLCLVSIRLVTDVRRLSKYVKTYIKLEDTAKKVRDAILGPKAVVVSMLIAALIIAYKLWPTATAQAQGSAVSYPIQEEGAKTDDTYKPAVVQARMLQPVNPTSTGKQIAPLIMSHMKILRFYDEPTEGEECMGLPIMTYYMLVPTHMLEKQRKWMSIISEDSNVHNYSKKILLEGAHEPIPGTDYSIVYTPSIGDVYDFRKFIPARKALRGGKLNMKHVACRLSYVDFNYTVDADGKHYRKLGRYNVGVNVSSCVVKVQDRPVLEGAIYDFVKNTYEGLCGAVAVTEGSDCFIAGFHCAGMNGSKSGRLNTLYREDIDLVIEQMTGPKTAMMQGAEQVVMNLDYEKFPYVNELPAVSSANFIQGEYEVLGKHTGQVRTQRSAVIVSPISETIEDVFGEPRLHAKPKLLNSWKPASVWMENCTAPAHFPMSDLNKAYDSLCSRIIGECEKNPQWKPLITKIPDDVVINGMDGFKGCGSLNFNASIGIPECRPKREFLIPTDKQVPGISCYRMYNDDIMKKYHDMEESLKRGHRVYSPFRVNVKDEATKLTSEKVRIFSGGENSLLMLLRKYFLTVSMFMQNRMELFESAVGASSVGSDWDELKRIITKFGEERIIAGDYSKFDQFVTNAITLASFKILIAICMWAGYDEEDRVVMEALATEVCNPIYEMNGLWVMFGSSTASGHSLTVVINGLNNSLYMRMAFYAIAPLSFAEAFHDCVALMTYGDDNVMSVREDCGWFNHTSIQEWLAQYGITYTMADKLAESVPYIHFKDATFLKRSWVWDDELQLYKCPLEKASIFKMLHTVQLSKTEAVEQQVGNIISTANREFFQFGRETFEESRSKLLTVATTHELMHYIPNSHLETYDELMDWVTEQRC